MAAPLTMDDLLKNLQSASLTKQAADESKEDDKDTKDKSEKDDKEDKKDDKSDKSEKSDDEDKDDKKDEKDDKKFPAFLKKEAQDAGAALAQEVMQKVAAATLPSTTKDTDMNKQAQAAGAALADALIASLTKQANAGDVVTTNGTTPEGVPNKNQVDTAQLVAEDDAKIKPQPGAGGNVNQILDAIVQDTMAQGAASFDQVHTTGVAGQEGNVESAVPNQVKTASDEQEKAAAVSALVADGVDFDQAVNLVKQAEAEMEAEHELQVKQAAIGALMDRGVDFAQAVNMVKSAGALQVVQKGALVAKDAAKGGLSRGAKIGIGAAAAGAAAGGAYAATREKKAAFDALVQAGVDFDSAAQLVIAKSNELYGQ